MSAKISASADGLKVTIGNAAEAALEIDQTAKTIKGINGYLLGAPAVQTWQNMTASRAINTNYTNGTGQTIDVAWRATSALGSFINILVDDVLIVSAQNSATASSSITAYCRVPAGAVYRFEGSATKIAVMELR